MAAGPLDEAYNDLQYLVQDYANVHRVVLAWRAYRGASAEQERRKREKEKR